MNQFQRRARIAIRTPQRCLAVSRLTETARPPFGIAEDLSPRACNAGAVLPPTPLDGVEFKVQILKSMIPLPLFDAADKAQH